MAWIKTPSFIPTPTCVDTQFPALPHIQVLLSAPARTWMATSGLATKAAAWSAVGPPAQPLLTLPLPSRARVCMCVCVHVCVHACVSGAACLLITNPSSNLPTSPRQAVHMERHGPPQQ